MSRGRDRLEVMVLEAQGLLAVEGGVANPYISVEVGDEKRRTAVEPATVDPVWDEEIMVFSETTARNMEYLVLMVKHHDPVGSHTDRMLGMVIVDTATALQAPGISTQEWFPVRKGPGMKAGDAPQGKVHVKVTYFVNTPEELDRMDEEEMDDDGDSGNAKAPNVVTILVEAGRNLRPPGSKGVCDPLVAVRCGAKARQCKALKRTNNPKWHFQAEIGNVDPHELVLIEVMHSGTMSNKLIGQARLTMVEIAQAGESLTRWLPLLDGRWGFDAVGRGEVVVTARWHYDKHFTPTPTAVPSTFLGGKTKKREKEIKALETMIGEFEYEDENDEQNRKRDEERHKSTPGGDEELDDMEEGERTREALALAARAEFEERLEAVRPGDYQLQVHVIEVSDLKGKDASGTSDPIVYATCLGSTKHTRVRKGVNSAVFDEVLYFNPRGLSRDQLMQATVNLRVMDANTFSRSSLIGSYQFDLLEIYVNKGHEVYRTWVALQNTESEHEAGVQGFLKLSVTVLGPGDRQKVHDLAEEMQDELAKEAETGAGGRGGMVLMGPAMISQELRFLVVYVFSAEDLPRFSSVGVPSVNALVQVDFAGNPPLRTSTVKVKGRDGLSPWFAQELWLPVMVPAHSTTIDVSVWHKEMTGREVIAHAFFDLNSVREMSGTSDGEKRWPRLGRRAKKHYPGPPPTWANLYGAPVGKGKGREAEMMNRYPSRGTAYRGRLLVAMRVEARPPSELKNRGKRSAIESKIPPEIFPETAKYTLRALVIQGSDIPIFMFPNAQGASKMRVVVTLGHTTLEFRARSNRKGIVEWNQGDEVRMLELPADPAQIPDIIIYLVRDIPESRVSYARIPAVDVLSQRFHGDPYWQELVADKTRSGLWARGSDNFPGSLLIRLGLGRDAVARHNPWEEMLKLSQEDNAAGVSSSSLPTDVGPSAAKVSGIAIDRDEEKAGSDGNEGGVETTAAAVAAQGILGKKKPYCVRAHVFQCKGLPSSEASGLLDPYIKVRFMGRKHKTTHEGGTADPCFYQTIEFHDMLPDDLRLAPEVRVEVWDNDLLGSNTHVAGCRFPMSSATLSIGSSSRVPTPRWHQLRDTNGQPGVGELLFSLQLIAKRTAHDKFPRAASIIPKFRTAYLEVITLGVRDLKPHGFQAVAQPYVQFEMTSGGEQLSFTTRASKLPSGKNANFAERKVSTVILPENPLFAPQLCIKVIDKRISGLNNPVVGTCSVAMAPKMPWNDEGYQPPKSQSFSSRDKGDLDETLGGGGDPFTPKTSLPSPDRRNGPPGAGAAGHSRRQLDATNASANNSVGGSGVGDNIDTRGGANIGRRAQSNGAMRDNSAENSREVSLDGMAGEMITLTRPENFGVGAVDIRDGGGRRGGGEGVGLELPPIEEDQEYKKAMMRPDVEFSRRVIGGQGVGDGTGGRGKRPAVAINGGGTAGEGALASEAPAWYERLIQGGGKALGAIDTQEEEKWTLDELNIDFPKEWASSEFLEGRNWWLKREGGGNEIESFLKKAPFENYPLFLGAVKLKSGIRMFRQMQRRKVGLLKGLVVVSESPPDPNVSDFIDMSLLRAPRSYQCRIYVVKGMHLQPKDVNGLADPYLHFKIGKLREDDGKDKENIKMATLNPEFFRPFDFNVTLPGESQLKVKLYDYDRFGADDLIGQTVIDLEDRWFSQEWHDLEKQDPLACERRETHGPYKPLEVRDLTIPTSSSPQGQVMMWVDILTLQQARRFPPVSMEPPAPMKVEVRVVVWRSEDVIACNDFSGLRDLYCRLWMETDPKKKRDTDTHWRCKSGKGSWNYRLKFEVDLPLKSPEHGRLVLQMWDRDVLTANDIIAETSIDLYRWFLKVYREQRSTKPYLIMKEARRQKEHEESLAIGSYPLQSRGGAGNPPAGLALDQRKLSSRRYFGDDQDSQRTRRKTTRDRGHGDKYSDANASEGSLSSSESNLGDGTYEDDDDDDQEEDDGSDYETEAESGTDEEKPLLESAEHTRARAGVQNVQARQVQIDDTDEVVNTIKDWFGVGKAPDDARWLELTKRDPEAGTVERMGKVLISLELLPKDSADAQPVGSGRNEPNQNPYLPPAAGRMKFSFNPFRLSMSLLGPKAFYKVLCCCLCIIFAAFIALAGNYITTFESLF